ncbi:PIN domain-containing protein [Pseudomonas syringae]|uniref:PIN domain-containing protein n=1 Tax=Pseudomonas syringae TaxID=317 RepID=UPI00073F97C1|nr:PIN domain-containing protein [Pseudomonas syringae]
MRFFLDTNIWSYIANEGAGSELAMRAREAGVEIVISPAVVDEVQRLPVPEARRKVIQLVTRKDWKRLMPEIFSECAEVKSEIIRLRPEWVIAEPKMAEFRRLRYDWARASGGFWDRARRETETPATNESIRRDEEERLAVEQSYAIRERMKKIKPGSEEHLQKVGHIPEAATPGWSGDPIPYWRVPSLHMFRAELQIYESAVREWLDSEIDVAAMLSSPGSMNRLWLHELDAVAVPRQWLRGAFEFLQAWHKVTTGTPGDSRLATHLVDADVIISADKNFVRFAERCRDEAPFSIGKTLRAQANRAGVDEVLQWVSKPETL